MRKLVTLLFMMAVSACALAEKQSENLVLVEGGSFVNTKSNYYGKRVTKFPYNGKVVSIKSFLIGRYEVTQKEWSEVMGNNPSKFRDDNSPVETVSWYDAIEYCNKRSLKEGRKPYYNINKDNKDPNNHTDIDDVKWTVTIDTAANGYRLPTEIEWEYAASGGKMSKSYTYSGSDDIDKVAWYWKNAGDKNLTGEWHWPTIEKNNTKAKAVGGKEPNELGLYDMSGNVREWCWDWYGELQNNSETAPNSSTSESGRVWKGGGWIGGDFCCASSFRAGLEANGKGPDQGFRVCRSQ